MLRISVVRGSSAAVQYLKEENSRDAEEPSTARYLADERQHDGIILSGKAAERLGLAGEISTKQLESLLRNIHPETGERITSRTATNRRDGLLIDLNFTKEESLQLAIAPDPAVREKLIDAGRRVMAAIEADTACRVRVNGQNSDRVTGNALTAEFLHELSRQVDGVSDPHLHLHLLKANLTFDDVEQKWKAAQTGHIFKNAPFYESLFHHHCRQAWLDAGYELTERNGRWVPAGISEECARKFSRRTAIIEDEARRRGIEDPKRKSELGARTREKKDKSRTYEEHRQEWLTRLTPDERKAIEDARVKAETTRTEQREEKPKSREPSREPSVQRDEHRKAARKAIEKALEQALERDSSVTEKRLLALAMKKTETHIPLESLQAALKEKSLLRQEVRGETRLTTPEVLAEEKRMLAFAREGRGRSAPLAPDANVTGIGELGQQQYDAFRAVLGSYDRVTLLRGGAGTAKETLMKEVVRAIENRNRRVFPLAPSGQHARERLAEEGIANGHTIARLLADKEMQKSVKGQVLWVDQAGRIGVREMARIFDVAQKQDARVILSGDYKQHGPVSRGGAFGLLARDAGLKTVQLKAVERQRGDYRSAMSAVADGQMDAAWKRLERMEAFIELPKEQAHKQLAEEYVRSKQRGWKSLAVAPGRKEREQVNEAIRRQLREKGEIRGRTRRVDQLTSLGWTQAERRDSDNYRRGQVIKFFQPTRGFHTGDQTKVIGRDKLGNVWVKGKAGPQLLKTSHGDRFDVYEKRKLELARGDQIRITGSGKTAIGNHVLRSGSTYRIAGFVPLSGDLILNNGWVVRRNFGHLAHDYCVSSHAAQDKQVDRVFIAHSKDSFSAGSRQQFHASLGAARVSVRIFTDDANGLKEKVATLEKRPAATTLDERRMATDFQRHLDNVRRSHEHAPEPTR